MKFTTPFNNGATWAALGLVMSAGAQTVPVTPVATANATVLLAQVPSAAGPTLGLAGMIDKPVEPGIPKPMQTFFLPLTEIQLVNEGLKKVSSSTSGKFINMFAFAISTDNTVIWYDHWEDGYEVDVMKPVQPQTRIWGDGKASNGCAPNVPIASCTDANDKLNAGTTIQIIEQVDLTLRGAKIHYDGGDMVSASYPITVTRAGYSERPGSVLAGGIEVYDTEVWGTEYEIPVGENMGIEAFEMTQLFVMAKEPTVVSMANSTLKYNLDKGGQACIAVPKYSLTLSATKPVQAAIISGDRNSGYEMRWFSLQPKDNWSNDYHTPVGDTVGKTRVLLYNPSPTVNVVVNTTYLNTVTLAPISVLTVVRPKNWERSPPIPLDSGARLIGDGKFSAMTYTDTNSPGGDTYDWGMPLVPTNMLTPQVVIGLGYGCTANNCGSETARSPVWVTPTEDAFIFIDYNNSGNPAMYDVRRVKKLQSIRVRAPNAKKDMSGALIFATSWNGTAPITAANPSGRPVDIASAWGQDATVSGPNQAISMDLGTTVVPFTTIRVSKLTDVKLPEPNSFMTYTIRVMNVGQVNVPPGKFSIVDIGLDSCDYVANSTRYSIDGGLTKTPIPDDTVGSAFPLDGAGLVNKYEMPRRGGTHDISFKVYIDRDKLTKKSITNVGFVDEPLRQRQHFSVTTDILFKADIDIRNTVYVGHDDGKGCSNGVKLVNGTKGNDVTYCFEVRNSGNTHLKIKVDNPTLDNYAYTWPTIVKPGETFMLNVPRGIKGNLTNYAIAVGTPVFFDGKEIGIEKVSKQDPSAVQVAAELPSVSINNTVVDGPHDSGKLRCATSGGAKKASGFVDAPVTYCFTIKNTGNTFLGQIVTKNPDIDNFIHTYISDKPLAPGASFAIPIPLTIAKALNNTATVTANPVLVDGTPIFSSAGIPLPPVTNSDTSGVVPLDSRSGGKDPFTPPGSTGQITQCLKPHWHDAIPKTPLSCKAKEVYFTNIKNNVRLPPCVEGSKVKVDISADWYFKSARYDPVFYVALDGGDALNGTCLLKGLEQVAPPLGTYKVVDPNNNATVVGSVAWNADHRGGNDKCGDVVISLGGDAAISRMPVVNTEVICRDRDKDGILDVAVCMSWRTKSTDGVCTLVKNDPATKGLLPDAYPGLPSDCFCDIYNVPDIPVTPIPPGRTDVCL